MASLNRRKAAMCSWRELSPPPPVPTESGEATISDVPRLHFLREAVRVFSGRASASGGRLPWWRSQACQPLEAIGD
jgi:hypothetical protein